MFVESSGAVAAKTLLLLAALRVEPIQEERDFQLLP
jgi:hypothetical protein